MGLFPLLDVLVRGVAGAIRFGHAELELVVQERDKRLPWPKDLLAVINLELALLDQHFGHIDETTLGVSRWLYASSLGRAVHQQLAVLLLEGLDAELGPHEAAAAKSAWREVLLLGEQRTERGKRLLEWLRLGSVNARCYECDDQATGLCFRVCPPEGWVHACSKHRTEPRRAWKSGATAGQPWQPWQEHAYDLGLDPVPVLKTEVDHG